MIADLAEPRPARAGWIVFAALLALYAASLAPRVTFWDAGEFIAAIHTWGIPHPPGTPLHVTLGRALEIVLGALPTSLVASLLSALCTAAACALGALLLVRRGATSAAATAAGICAGGMTSVWLNATEAEVYSVSLLLSALMLVVAERAGRAGREADYTQGSKRRALLAYLFALAAPLHPSALVAGPAAIWLALDDGIAGARRTRDRWWHGALLGVSLVAAGALATGRFTLAAIGGVALVALAVAERVAALRVRGAEGDAARDTHADATRALVALALGATPLLIMLLRARLDPAINQGNPATWHALGDEIARRQYEVAGLWPRQAPPWLQLANVLQYADWQVAFGLAPESTVSVPRLLISLLFVAAAVAGARAHRARDRRSFRALLVLLVAGSLGVMTYLNLKAGPSIGWGILPDSAPHEARERDYFFVLGFWGWGLLAGYGMVAVTTRLLGSRSARVAATVGIALASLPALLNWPVMNRRREPDASAPSLVAQALLTSTPPNGVLVVWGDNDSYPLWEAQQARGTRRDVTVVTSPLLGAAWYRDELRRRWRIDAGPLAPERTMVARVAASARAGGRPLAFAVTVPAETRAAAGGSWSLCGAAWIEGDGRCGFAGADSLDRFLRAHPAGRRTDLTTRSMLDVLRCARIATGAPYDLVASDSLAGACNAR